MGCTGGNTRWKIAVHAMATAKPRCAPLPDEREAYRGVAFERNESAHGWKRRKAQAQEITDRIMAMLEQVAALLQTLGALGWDGGGQPFVCETTMKKTRDKARADGRDYAFKRTVRSSGGGRFEKTDRSNKQQQQQHVQNLHIHAVRARSLLV